MSMFLWWSGQGEKVREVKVQRPLSLLRAFTDATYLHFVSTCVATTVRYLFHLPTLSQVISWCASLS